MSKGSELAPLGYQTDEGNNTMAAIVASGKKPSTAKKVRAKAAPKPVEHVRRRLNRVGTQVHDASDLPETIGGRMGKARIALGVTQAEVASRISFTPKSGKRGGRERPLSRNAYCMYETDQVRPDIPKVEEIARALETTPQYIAFGVSEEADIHEYLFDGKKFVEDGAWRLPESWLRQQYDASPKALGVFMLADYSENFVAGDVAIFHKGSEPTGAGGSFIFALKGEIKIAHITRMPRSELIRIFTADLKDHADVPMKQVTILGRVIGKIGSLERN